MNSRKGNSHSRVFCRLLPGFSQQFEFTKGWTGQIISPGRSGQDLSHTKSKVRSGQPKSLLEDTPWRWPRLKGEPKPQGFVREFKDGINRVGRGWYQDVPDTTKGDRNPLQPKFTCDYKTPSWLLPVFYSCEELNGFEKFIAQLGAFTVFLCDHWRNCGLWIFLHLSAPLESEGSWDECPAWIGHGLAAPLSVGHAPCDSSCQHKSQLQTGAESSLSSLLPLLSSSSQPLVSLKTFQTHS